MKNLVIIIATIVSSFTVSSTQSQSFDDGIKEIKSDLETLKVIVDYMDQNHIQNTFGVITQMLVFIDHESSLLEEKVILCPEYYTEEVCNLIQDTFNGIKSDLKARERYMLHLKEQIKDNKHIGTIGINRYIEEEIKFWNKEIDMLEELAMYFE